MMTYRVKRILWGLVFVAIGIGYLGTQLDWWDFTKIGRASCRERVSSPV